MSDKSKIEWTDATWNPITGCSVVSKGCTNCYAMKLAGTRLKNHASRVGLTSETAAGPVWSGEVRFNNEWLDKPFRWKKPRRIFVCAHSDLFHEKVPDAWIDQIFAVMASSPQHQFQILTKRPKRMQQYLSQDRRIDWADACKGIGLDGASNFLLERDKVLPNVWVGVSVEDQKTADERIPFLLKTPAAIRWISAEPILGAIDLNQDYLEGFHFGELLHWVVAGGESQTGSRPTHPSWFRQLRDQCDRAGIPFLFKQWGDWKEPTEGIASTAKVATIGGGKLPEVAMVRVGKKTAGRLLDGKYHDAYPCL